MADFPVYDGSVFQAIGVSTSTSKGTTLTSGVSGHTKGSWVELSSSAPEGITSFVVQLYNTQESSSASRVSVDIGIGSAGSEVVLVPDLRTLMRTMTTAGTFYIPMAIPGGVRVAARLQAGTGGSRTCDVAIGVFRGGFLSSPPLTQATHYGFVSAGTVGTEVDPGAAANTKGAASEITASCTNPIRSMILCIGNTSDANYNPPTRLDDGYLLDIGVGATPDYIITNYPLTTCTPIDCLSPWVVGPFDCCIPAGTRIVARAQSSENADPPRKFDLSILGFN